MRSLHAGVLDELPNALTSRWLPNCRGHIRQELSTSDDVSICVCVCMRGTAGTRRGWSSILLHAR